MKLKYKFVVQEVADGFVAVTVGPDASKFSGIIRMNGTSAFVFDLLKEEITMDEIVRKMYEKYDADEEVLRKDAEKFTAGLREANLLS